MKTRWFVAVAMVLVALAVPVSAAEPLPSIVTFESDLPSITVQEAETGAVTATLSWHTTGVTEGYRLRLHSYRLNNWELVFDENSVPLEPIGSREVTIRHPLNFGPPTYLLSIVDAQSRIVDQRPLSIPYEIDEASTPVIESFTANTLAVEANALSQGAARVTVAWEVSDRLPASNLVFEQVFADESVASVELPRSNRWIPSTGEGPVAPAGRAGATAVILRLSVVDVVSGEVYDEEELSLGITGVVTEPAAAQGLPTPLVPGTGGQVVAFTAEPDMVNPGAAVTLSWEIQGTGGVTIEQSVPNMALVETVVTAQSPRGSTTVYLPDYAAYSVQYTLYTANRSGSASAVVQINCPYTFFFGQGDGCPAGEAREVEAAYEEFEGGIMVWRGDTREIYVFYDDGTASYFLEASYAGMADRPADAMPPLDRYAPVSGFGRVWANAPGVREKLGWALMPEQGYRMMIQGVAVTRTPPPEFSFVLRLPDGSLVGSGFGTWRAIP